MRALPRLCNGLLLGIAVVALAACGGGKGGTTEQAAGTGAGAPCTPATPHSHPAGGYPREKLQLNPAKTYELVFQTNCGSFTVTLDPKLAPNATSSLVSLAKRGFFTDTYFHRIVPGFVIQGGDPTGTGTGGPSYRTVDKPPRGTRYTHGVVAMAKTAAEPAGTAGSQFFVVTGADARLPAEYAVVGKVTSGLDVVDRIGKLGDPATEQPTSPVVISGVRVVVS
jgi:cyclophilin family peptidyl-prolyl cis-trans isomerase